MVQCGPFSLFINGNQYGITVIVAPPEIRNQYGKPVDVALLLLKMACDKAPS